MVTVVNLIHTVIYAYIECDGVSFLNDDKDENADLKREPWAIND